MTRQSAHILMASARLLLAGNIQCRPSSLAATLSIVLLTPNGLLQRMQSAGSSSLRIRGRARGGREIDLRRQRDHLFRARALAQPALHAGVFDEFQRRAIGIVEQRAGRACRHAGKAQRASADIDADGPDRRAFGQRDDVGRRGRDAMQLCQGEAQQIAPLADGFEGRRTLDRCAGFDPAQGRAERIRIVGLDRGNAAVPKIPVRKEWRRPSQWSAKVRRCRAAAWRAAEIARPPRHGRMPPRSLPHRPASPR